MEELLKRLQERATRRIGYAEASSVWLLRQFRQLQSLLFSFFISRYIDDIFPDSGPARLTVSSAVNAPRVAALIQAEYDAQAQGLLQRIALRMARLMSHNTSYFELLGLPESEGLTATRLVMLSYGYDPATGQPIPGGWLQGVLGSPQLAQAVGQQLREALAAGLTKREFLAKFRQVFVNPGGQGILERHFNRFAQDLFMQQDRLANITLAEAAELRHFIYAGTEVRDSRHFCLQRLNRVYDTDFAEGWDSLDWQGKIPNVPAMQQLGGYNCRHSLMFISAELVPVIEAQQGKVNEYNKVVKKTKAATP
jgi:hypothetical protein